jgi:hypothetical protein
MADRFFDTSAIAKHYRVELGTARVDSFLAEKASRQFVSALGVIELHSVFVRLVRTSQITAADFPLVRGRFLADLAFGLWQVVPISASHFQDAQRRGFYVECPRVLGLCHCSGWALRIEPCWTEPRTPSPMGFQCPRPFDPCSLSGHSRPRQLVFLLFLLTLGPAHPRRGCLGRWQVRPFFPYHRPRRAPRPCHAADVVLPWRLTRHPAITNYPAPSW